MEVVIPRRVSVNNEVGLRLRRADCLKGFNYIRGRFHDILHDASFAYPDEDLVQT